MQRSKKFAEKDFICILGGISFENSVEGDVGVRTKLIRAFGSIL